MLKAAVIGVGSMGSNHARIYRDMATVELTSVVDRSEATAARIGEHHNVPYYVDVDRMLDDCQPDLASVAVPTSLHFEVAARLMERGVHVLVEKPIASTVE